MLIVGLQGSPRRRSNTRFLLRTFFQEAEKMGAITHLINAPEMNIKPCRGCGMCEKEGICTITNDVMMPEIFPLLRQADAIIVATPVYFYHTTAQLKCLIDRCQTFWSRKYKLKLTDPGAKSRIGFLLSAGATKGKNLFEGIHLSMNVFCDAVGAGYKGGRTYRGIENPGDMESHPSVSDDIKASVQSLLRPMLQRPRFFFVCKGNSCRSQMAAAFARYLAGEKLDALSAGTHPEADINPAMEKAMREKHIDMAFLSPKTLETAMLHGTPDKVIIMGSDVAPPSLHGVECENWELIDPFGRPDEIMRKVRDEIEVKVKKLIQQTFPSPLRPHV